MMKILVIGAEGQVGHFLLKQLSSIHEVHGTSMLGVNDLPGLDICDAALTESYINNIKPDYVILTAALTNVDGCEKEPEKARQINVEGARHVAQACRNIDAGLAFFSSEYVFDGHFGPYSEEDVPNPHSMYGKTKLAGEKIVTELVKNHLIIRTTVVFSYLPDSMNFFMQLLRRAKNNEPIRVPGDQIGTPTQAVNLAAALGELIEKKQTGIFNLVGTTRIGRDGFTGKLLNKLGYPDKTFEVVATKELNQLAPRPLIAGLKTDKAQAVLEKHKLWNLDQALDFTIKQIPE